MADVDVHDEIERLRAGEGRTADGRLAIERVLSAECGGGDVQQDTERFLEVMALLGSKCGPLVLQFPYFNKQAFANAKPDAECPDGNEVEVGILTRRASGTSSPSRSGRARSASVLNARLTTADVTPTWYPGDEFEAKRQEALADLNR